MKYCLNDNAVIAIAALLFTNLTEGKALSGPCPQMSLSCFNSMMFTEARSELVVNNHGETIFEQLTKDYWNDPQQGNSIYKDELYTFIICNCNPETSSSLERRILLEDEIQAFMSRDSTSRAGEGRMFVDPIPLYISDSHTCFFTSLPSIFARRIEKDVCVRNHTICKIQPLLPVMKFSEGIVATARNLKPDHQILVVYIVLSPFGATLDQQFLWQNLAKVLALKEDSGEVCVDILQRALPSSASNINCSTSQELYGYFSPENFGDGVVTLTLDLAEVNQEVQILGDSLLIFLSKLAAIPFLQSIEIE